MAGIGHGSVHQALQAARLRAQAAGVRILRCSRVAVGPVFAQAGDALPAGGELSPYQARIELLQLLHAGKRPARAGRWLVVDTFRPLIRDPEPT